MRLAMVSQNGGLKVASAPPEGFTNLLDYTVTLHAVGTGGTSIVASCSASSLAAAAIPPCSFRGTASATTGLRLSRSEEHTSELQSLMRISYAVFCLKKKKHTQHTNHTITTIITNRHPSYYYKE